MASVRGYALRGVKADPASGPETVLKARDRLHAMIACGEESLEIEAYVVLGDERIPLAEYAVRSLQLKDERLERRARSSSTVADLKAALLAMTPDQQTLPIKILVPATKGSRDREMFAYGYLANKYGHRTIWGIPVGKAAKHTPHGYNDIKTVSDMLALMEDKYATYRRWDDKRPLSPVEPDSKVLVRINTAENTDSFVGFHVSRIQVREDAVVLRYLPDELIAA